MHFVRRGTVGGRRVVLHHPLASSSSFFDDVSLSECDVVAYDARGHGQSPCTEGPYSWQQLLEDLLSVVDRAWGKDSSFTFVGVSMGGMLGQHLALSPHSDRLERLVLCSTSLSTAAAGAMWKDRMASVSREGSLASLADPTMRRWFSPAAPAAVVERARGVFLSTPVAGYLGHAAAIAAHDVAPEALRKAVKCPALVVCGSEDAGTNVAGHQELAGAIDGARLVVLAGLAHAAPAEAPLLFGDTLKAFLFN